MSRVTTSELVDALRQGATLAEQGATLPEVLRRIAAIIEQEPLTNQIGG